MIERLAFVWLKIVGFLKALNNEWTLALAAVLVFLSSWRSRKWRAKARTKQ